MARAAGSSDMQLTRYEQEVDVLELEAPVASLCERQTEGYTIAPEPYKAPVAQMR